MLIVIAREGSPISWCDEVRYLGILPISPLTEHFGCLFKHARAAFCHQSNAIIGKIGHTASEDVVT